MIVFLTLLLGLVSGTVPIEVATGGPVSRVEVLLDGVPVREIAAPPWSAAVNLGSDLQPHVLVARALDAEGGEIARTAQWINLPRPAAEVEVVLESGLSGKPATARLFWQSVDNAAPASIGLTLDGEPLVLDAERRVALPKLDLKDPHVLTAEVWFRPGVSGRRDVAFGGVYGSAIATELTAVPVRVPKAGGGSIAPSALHGRFTAAGQPLEVAAVEEGEGKVIVVRVPDAQLLSDRWTPFDRGIEAHGEPPKQEEIVSGTGGPRHDLYSALSLGGGSVARLLSPLARGFAGPGVPADLFEVSRDLSARDGGLLRILTRLNLSVSRPPATPQRIADAVAVAGLHAAIENRRRAVVLVLGDGEGDASRYTPEQVRRYLAAIRVPLFVWSPYGTKGKAAQAWGAGVAEDVSTLPKLYRAFDRLKADLDSQRIVWVEGRHLPQTVSLAPGASVQEDLR